jgi:hypothetical protein
MNTLKKINIYLIFFLAFSLNSYAQFEKSTRIGLQTGTSINLAKITIGSAINQKAFAYFAPALVSNIH